MITSTNGGNTNYGHRDYQQTITQCAQWSIRRRSKRHGDRQPVIKQRQLSEEDPLLSLDPFENADKLTSHFSRSTTASRNRRSAQISRAASGKPISTAIPAATSVRKPENQWLRLKQLATKADQLADEQGSLTAFFHKESESSSATETREATTAVATVYCAPFCDDGDFESMSFPDYADVEPETGSNVGNEYH
ncbi:hypothetical protein QR680_006301 [Steinernema hermaphroditum]|uniref:Uncharacterized protein n=1 Tax=Steinernema hermaphroditum TaxID=289476 RepID=A0AA39LWW4_9BILA|nr:hypothetical protein QR680_006301 [Steinernema hermaphroditum]